MCTIGTGKPLIGTDRKLLVQHTAGNPWKPLIGIDRKPWVQQETLGTAIKPFVQMGNHWYSWETNGTSEEPPVHLRNHIGETWKPLVQL